MELFCGVIHPSAGLFEDYFDLEQAAREHQNNIAMLQQQGIRVHTVTGILSEVRVDTLRVLAGRVLNYDISDSEEKFRCTVNLIVLALIISTLTITIFFPTNLSAVCCSSASITEGVMLVSSTSPIK